MKDFFPETCRSLVKLEIKGKIPSFKNNKMLMAKDPRGRPLRRPMLITKPEFQEQMRLIVDSLQSQLRCAFRTADGRTLTGSSLRSAIALSLPANDCWLDIPIIQICGEMCEPGQEGATITIMRL